MNKKKKHIIITLVIAVIATAVTLWCIKINNGPYLPLGNADFNKVPAAVPEKYDEYYENNNDFVGWIKIDGTAIDYPVVQADDNEFYLIHNFDKEYEARGSIFMSFDCDPQLKSKNTVIHGHNWLDDTVFSELAEYSSFNYYKKHPVIEFNTRTEMHKWKIISVFITSADPTEDNDYVFNYTYPNMGGDNFAKYSEELKKRTLFHTNVDYNENDQFLTLSTCTREVDKDGKRADCRIAIVARMIRPNENEYADTSLADVNKNPKYPQIWYTNKNLSNPYINDEKWYPYEITQ